MGILMIITNLIIAFANFGASSISIALTYQPKAPECLLNDEQ